MMQHSLIPHTRVALITGWTAVAAHALALTGIAIAIATR